MKRKMNINRRSAMKTIGALGVASTLVSAKAFGQTKKADAYALVGGSTPVEVAKKSFDETIVKELNVTIDYQEDHTKINASILKGYRLLITAIGGIPNITLSQEKDIQAFILNGGAALILHNSPTISTDTVIMRDIIGGNWLQHTEIRPYRVIITNRNHPITQGVNDFETTGEQHYSQYDKDPSYVFMKNESIDGWSYNNIEGDKHYDKRLGDRGFGPSRSSGWAYDYGKGRVCYMAPGHNYEEYRNPEYVKLQHNAVSWCLRQI